MKKRRLAAPFVTVTASLALAALACDKTPATGSAGATSSDGSELRHWDDVKSDHPEGATNPPHPVLNVNREGTACAKSYEGGLGGPPGDAVPIAIRGGTYHVRIVEQGSLPGVPIHCPEGTTDAVKSNLTNPTPSNTP